MVNVERGCFSLNLLEYLSENSKSNFWSIVFVKGFVIFSGVPRPEVEVRGCAGEVGGGGREV